MANSMTSYGRSTGNTGTKAVTVEIKSVNSRYLDLSIRISKGFTFLEEKLRQYIASRISRGKVDLYIGIEVTADSGARMELDSEYAASYISALKELRDRFSLTDDISVMSVSQNRDIFRTVRDEEDQNKVFSEILPFLDEALEGFARMRAAEGENIAADLIEKKNSLVPMTEKISSLSERCIKNYKDKFEARLRRILDESGVEIDQQRILTECAIYADKVAIDEELVRLSSHFKAYDEIFSLYEPVGRKLDFLLQEMNREVNTIGSKCSDAEIARVVVDIKCELEKIREQVQNLE